MNIRDNLFMHAGSKDSKDSGSDSDSLEYSNDDQSWNNKGETADRKRPPVHPLSSAENLDAQDKNANISTPKRRQDDNKQFPGPLNLFSPGLSPIGHSSGPKNPESQAAEDVKATPHSSAKSMHSNEDLYRQELNDSVDSLDMHGEFFPDGHVGAPEERTPHYRFWKNKLFGEDVGDSSFAVGDEGKAEVDVHGDGNGVRSNNQSFDSDIHVTKQSLVYPTTEAVYANSAQDALDYSMDSDIHVTKQSLVYPTTPALYEQTAPRSPVSSPRFPAHRTDTSLLLKQSLLALPAEERPASARRDYADDEAEEEGEEDLHLMKESYLHASFRGDQRSLHNFTFSNISLLNDSASSSFDHTPQETSMRSISLLPGSPVMMSTYGMEAHDRSHAHQPARIAIARARPVPAEVKKVNMRPSAAAVRLKQLVTSSDTEFVSSTSRRRAAEVAARAAPHARDTSDLLSAAPKDPQLAKSVSVPQQPRAASPLKHAKANQGEADNHSTSTQSSLESNGRYAAQSTSVPHRLAGASLDRPSPSASVGSSSNRPYSSATRTHSPDRAASRPQAASLASMTAQSHAQLVVGGLYTLMLDEQGRPAFVPVLASPQASQDHTPGGHTQYMMPQHSPPSSAQQYSPPAQKQLHNQEQHYSQQHQHHQQFSGSYQYYPSASAPQPMPPQQQSQYLQEYLQPYHPQYHQQYQPQQPQSAFHYAPPPAQPTAVRHDPYRSNFAPPSVTSPLDPRNAYNSNNVDLEKVLDRALNHGSLSASKVDKRWRESPPGSAGSGTSDSDRDSGRDVGARFFGDATSPTYKRPANTAQTPTLSRAPPKSPFRVGLTEDGREQLLPGSEYWRERLMMITLTSALPLSQLQEVPPRRSRSVLSPSEKHSPDWISGIAPGNSSSVPQTLRF